MKEALTDYVQTPVTLLSSMLEWLSWNGNDNERYPDLRDQMGFWDRGLRVWLVGCIVTSLYKQTHVQNLLIYFIMMLYLATIWCCLPACNI